MKKFTFLLTLLLTLLISQEVQALSTYYFVTGRTASITTGKKYMIYNTARRYFLSANGSGYAVTNNTTPLTYTTTNANYVWTLEAGSASGTFKIKNVGTSTYAAGGTSLGSAIDYTVAEYSTCPSKGGMESYNDNGTTTAAASITSSDRAVYIKAESGSNPYWNGTGDRFTTTGAAHVYVLYEVVEIADGGLYTIDFVSQDGTKTWGLSTSGTSASATLNTTGSTFVAYSYTSTNGNLRWIFVNNTDGYFLAYQSANANFDTSNAINEWNIQTMVTSTSEYITGGDRTGLMYITNDKRFTNNSDKGCYILKESTAAFDKTKDPQWNGTFTSALRIKPVSGVPSSAAELAIAKFDALYKVKKFNTTVAHIPALYPSTTVSSAVSTQITGINNATNLAGVVSALDEDALWKIAEGRKFYAVQSTATDKYMYLGTSQITATSTKLYAEAVMEVEYASNGKYYLKGVKSGYYAGNPSSGSANPGTHATTATAQTLYVGNYDGSTDNKVYFARSKTNAIEAIHYNSGYSAQGNVVAWSYSAGASQWNITYISDDDYETLCNVCDVTYNVLLEASGTVKATTTETNIIGEDLDVPTAAARDYCTYTFYSDAACTEEITKVPDAASATVYALASYTMPFTISSSFNNATWYYATLRGKQLRADDSAKDGSGRYSTNSTNGRTDEYKWAFFGNPYDNFYVMNKNQGSSKYMYKDSQIIFSNPADPTADNKALWAVTANSNDGFTLRNIDGGSNWYINDAGNNGNLGFWNSASGKNDGGSKWVVTEVSTGDKAFLKSAIDYAQTLVEYPGVPGYLSTDGASTLSTAITTAQGVYNNASGDWVSAESTLRTAIATAKATISYIPRTDKYYTIVNARGAMVYDSSHDASVDTSNDNAEYVWYGSTTPDATDVNNLWGFIEQDGNYYMYNVGKQQFATVGTGTYGSTWIFSDVPAYITLDDGIADEIPFPKVRVRATIATTSTTYTMSVSTSYTGPVITHDAANDGGVPMIFAESSVDIDDDITDIMTSKVTDLTPFRNALQDAIDACEAKVGSGLNQYASNSAYATALADAKTEKANESATKGSLQEAQSDLETAYAALTLNLPTTGKFYRIQGATSEKYLAAGLASNGKFNMTTATDATTIFYYDSNKKLTNLSSGLYNGVTKSAWAWVVGQSASTVTFKDGITNGGYAIQTDEAHFYDNGDGTNSADRGGAISNMSDAHVRYRSWYLTEVTTTTLTLNDGGDGYYYATLCLPFDVTLNAAAAYTLTMNSSKTGLTLSEAMSEIAAGTPVFIRHDAETLTATIGTGYATTPSTSTSLTGCYVSTAVDANTVYTLGKENGYIGFYKYTGTSIAANRAYVSHEVGESARGFVLDFGELTGISNVESQKESNVIYDMQGRRVQKAGKGLYIVNGKKVLY